MRRILVSILGAGLALLLAAGPALADSYTVKRGDTLSHIAAEHGTSWPEIFELNRQIIDDPDLIFPGQVLAVDGPKASASKPADSSVDAEPSGTVRPATGQVTSPYGMRTHPITGVYKLHTGTDYGYGDGNAYAARAGTVVSTAWVDWAGPLVVIDHGGGVRTRYAHLAAVTVGPGDRVAAGDVVGRIGSTGYATGPHLHFEVMVNGEFVDPAGWLD